MRRYYGVILILAAGCASHTVTKAPLSPGTVTTTASERIRVMESPDGAFGSATYQGSGRQVSGRVLKALQGAYVDVALVPTVRESDALDVARADGASLLIEPTILHWEDRNPMWSKTPDRLQVRLALRDVASNAVLNSITFEARSRIFVMGNPPPDALLDGGFDRAVLDLLQR